MRTRARLRTALIGGLLVTAFAASAEAKIVPQKGIAGINLGMTVSEVIDKKGRPDSDRVGQSETVGEQRELGYGKTKALFAGADDDAKLIGVITKKRAERTAGGSGIGTSEEDLVADLPRVECKNIFGGRHCLIGTLRPGRTVTDFLISEKTGSVKRVTVAIVTD